jgi:hypothetical protein
VILSETGHRDGASKDPQQGAQSGRHMLVWSFSAFGPMSDMSRSLATYAGTRFRPSKGELVRSLVAGFKRLHLV